MRDSHTDMVANLACASGGSLAMFLTDPGVTLVHEDPDGSILVRVSGSERIVLLFPTTVEYRKLYPWRRWGAKYN